jgi:murein DD-endopeptidase MepM/ murein hydrolase activator NlpD
LNFIKPIEPWKISSKFGYRIHPITRKRQFHNGIDLVAPTGTPIKNISKGRVNKVYYNSIGGNQIVIDHDNGFQSGYAHLDSTNVKENDKIRAGHIIGTVGTTGKSTGSHLHFRIKDRQDQYIDPGNENLYRRFAIDFLEFLIFPVLLLLITQINKK